MSPLPDDPAFVQQQDQVGVGNGAEVVRIVRQVLPAMRDVRASRTLASLSTSNIRSRPLKTSQRRGYARRKRSVPRLSRVPNPAKRLKVVQRPETVYRLLIPRSH